MGTPQHSQRSQATHCVFSCRIEKLPPADCTTCGFPFLHRRTPLPVPCVSQIIVIYFVRKAFQSLLAYPVRVSESRKPFQIEMWETRSMARATGKGDKNGQQGRETETKAELKDDLDALFKLPL